MNSLEKLEAVDVPGREILRCEVGSTLHGIGIGSDDLDLMGVTIEPRSAITGLGKFEHLTWRSAREGQRSGPEDIDLVVYGLKKYVRLATTGNPTVILMLYAQERHLFHVDELGRELRDCGPASCRRNAGRGSSATSSRSAASCSRTTTQDKAAPTIAARNGLRTWSVSASKAAS